MILMVADTTGSALANSHAMANRFAALARQAACGTASNSLSIISTATRAAEPASMIPLFRLISPILFITSLCMLEKNRLGSDMISLCKAPAPLAVATKRV